MSNRPIIIFAKTSKERDFLRNFVSENDSSILSFEKDTICFDNLCSINAQFIVVRTDNPALVWRFLFALHLLNLETSLILISDKLGNEHFDLYGLNVSLTCMVTSELTNRLGFNVEKLRPKKAKKDSIFYRRLFVGKTEQVRRINSMLPNLNETKDTVLITGELGTGKELLSRMIAFSNYTNAVFIKIDCDAFRSDRVLKSCAMDISSNGRFIELFHQIPKDNKAITVLLHKIDCLDNDAQNDILYLLENRLEWKTAATDPEVRYISTSEKNLQDLVKEGVFRKDLYYRLNTIPIDLPPLKNRMNDITLLADYFSIAACTETGKSYVFPSSETKEQLCNYNWPGNIEELERTINKYVTTGDDEVLNQVKKNPENIAAPTQILYQTMKAVTEPNVVEIKNCFSALGDLPLKAICEKFAFRTEKKLMQKALEATNWNRKKAAALLNISYKSMLNKMKIYEIV